MAVRKFLGGKDGEKADCRGRALDRGTLQPRREPEMIGRAQFEKVESRVAMLRQQRGA
jgi:hypothetical protein